MVWPLVASAAISIGTAVAKGAQARRARKLQEQARRTANSEHKANYAEAAAAGAKAARAAALHQGMAMSRGSGSMSSQAAAGQAAQQAAPAAAAQAQLAGARIGEGYAQGANAYMGPNLDKNFGYGDRRDAVGNALIDGVGTGVQSMADAFGDEAPGGNPGGAVGAEPVPLIQQAGTAQSAAPSVPFNREMSDGVTPDQMNDADFDGANAYSGGFNDKPGSDERMKKNVKPLNVGPRYDIKMGSARMEEPTPPRYGIKMGEAREEPTPPGYDIQIGSARMEEPVPPRIIFGEARMEESPRYDIKMGEARMEPVRMPQGKAERMADLDRRGATTVAGIQSKAPPRLSYQSVAGPRDKVAQMAELDRRREATIQGIQGTSGLASALDKRKEEIIAQINAPSRLNVSPQAQELQSRGDATVRGIQAPSVLPRAPQAQAPAARPAPAKTTRVIARPMGQSVKSGFAQPGAAPARAKTYDDHMDDAALSLRGESVVRRPAPAADATTMEEANELLAAMPDQAQPDDPAFASRKNFISDDEFMRNVATDNFSDNTAGVERERRRRAEAGVNPDAPYEDGRPGPAQAEAATGANVNTTRRYGENRPTGTLRHQVPHGGVNITGWSAEELRDYMAKNPDFGVRGDGSFGFLGDPASGTGGMHRGGSQQEAPPGNVGRDSQTGELYMAPGPQPAQDSREVALPKNAYSNRIKQSGGGFAPGKGYAESYYVPEGQHGRYQVKLPVIDMSGQRPAGQAPPAAPAQTAPTQVAKDAEYRSWQQAIRQDNRSEDEVAFDEILEKEGQRKANLSTAEERAELMKLAGKGRGSGKSTPGLDISIGGVEDIAGGGYAPALLLPDEPLTADNPAETAAAQREFIKEEISSEAIPPGTNINTVKLSDFPEDVRAEIVKGAAARIRAKREEQVSADSERASARKESDYPGYGKRNPLPQHVDLKKSDELRAKAEEKPRADWDEYQKKLWVEKASTVKGVTPRKLTAPPEPFSHSESTKGAYAREKKKKNDEGYQAYGARKTEEKAAAEKRKREEAERKKKREAEEAAHRKRLEEEFRTLSDRFGGPAKPAGDWAKGKST